MSASNGQGEGGSHARPAANHPPRLAAVDLHIHTRYSPDVRLIYTVSDVAEHASQLGFSAIGIAEHCDYVGSGFVRRQNRLIESAREKYDLEILSGLEVEMDGCGRLTVDPEVALQVDYLIGSIHQLPGKTIYWEDEVGIEALVAELGIERMVGLWTEAALAGIGGGQFHIFGHPFEIFRKWGLIRRGHISGYGDPVLQQAGLQVAQAAARHGVAIEINNHTASFPGYEDFVSTCYAAGTLFSIGSDAHSLARVGVVADAVHLLRRVGVPAERIVTPRHLRSRPVPTGRRQPC